MHDCVWKRGRCDFGSARLLVVEVPTLDTSHTAMAISWHRCGGTQPPKRDGDFISPKKRLL